MSFALEVAAEVAAIRKNIKIFNDAINKTINYCVSKAFNKDDAISISSAAPNIFWEAYQTKQSKLPVAERVFISDFYINKIWHSVLLSYESSNNAQEFKQTLTKFMKHLVKIYTFKIKALATGSEQK